MLSKRHMIASFLFFVFLSIIPLLKRDTSYVAPVMNHEQVEIIKEEANLAKKYIKCMATNIYHEARGESFLGQVAVARVVVNRVNSEKFPKNPCTVIYQTHLVTDPITTESKKVCQFSWVCEGLRVDTSSTSYQQAVDIASQVLLENKWADLIPSDVLYFHASEANKKKNGLVIGNHIFHTGVDKKK